MGERKRLVWLILIMTAVAMIILGITISLLYRTALNEERERLVETAQSQARLIEAIARFDALHSKESYPGGPTEATLSQIMDAHQHYRGFGDTGEFTLARRDGDHIDFLLRHRHDELDKPNPVPFDSDLAVPMQLALSGGSGTIIGRDYRGEIVVAAYEPVGELDLGIVAKMDLSEIRKPFVIAGLIAIGAALLVITAGAVLALRVTNPIIRRLTAQTEDLVSAIGQLEHEIEERRQADLNRQKEKDRAQNYLDMAGTILFTLDGEGRITLINRKGCKVLGYQESELLGQDWFSACLPERNRTAIRETFEKMMAGEIDSFEYHENPVRTREGDERIIAWHNTLLKDESGRIIGTLSSGEDITERKQAEEALYVARAELERRVEERTAELVEANKMLIRSREELQLLSSQLMTVQENERARIARELHDGIGQTLTAVKFMLEDTIDRLENGAAPSSRRSLADLVPMIQHSVEDVRRITMDLRPIILDDMGILETIAWLCREFQKIYSGIHLHSRIGVEEHEIPDNLKIVIFRILQEALNNVAKHSKATRVKLHLVKREGRLELFIEDNGRGFDPGNSKNGNPYGKGFGLGSMKERAGLSGGNFSIKSVLNKKTTVRARWPLKNGGQVSPSRLLSEREDPTSFNHKTGRKGYDDPLR